MMLLAQQTITSNISKCMRVWPARAAGWAAGIGAGLLKRLLPHRQLFDPLQIGRVPQPRRLGNVNRPLRAHRNFRVNDVFGPIALAGGNITGQGESRQRGHGDVVGAADAGLEHAAAPHRNVAGAANVVDLRAPR